MNAQKVVKYNLIMSCVLLAVFALMFVGVTIAYFTDTEQASATFTAGNVKIALSESAVMQDEHGNWVKDQNSLRTFGLVRDAEIYNYGKVYPGTNIYKDPTISNTGDVPEWLAAKIILTDGAGDLHKVIGYPGYAEIDIERLLTGGLLDQHVEVEDWNGIADVCVNENYAMIQIANGAEGTYEFFFLMLEPVPVNESVVLFEQIMFDQMWNNAHMQELSELKIQIQAFGVQMHQMDSCLTAMTEAFPEHFPFNTDIK